MAAADDLSGGENWTGGFYELLLVLGAADDARLDRAVRSLWRFAGVREGPVGPSAAALHELGHLRGSLTLPSGDRVVCGGYASRYEGVDTWSCTCRSARWRGWIAGSVASPSTSAAGRSR